MIPIVLICVGSLLTAFIIHAALTNTAQDTP